MQPSAVLQKQTKNIILVRENIFHTSQSFCRGQNKPDQIVSTVKNITCIIFMWNICRINKKTQIVNNVFLMTHQVLKLSFSEGVWRFFSTDNKGVAL